MKRSSKRGENQEYVGILLYGNKIDARTIKQQLYIRLISKSIKNPDLNGLKKLNSIKLAQCIFPSPNLPVPQFKF